MTDEEIIRLTSDPPTLLENERHNDLVERVARAIYDHFDKPFETGLHQARKAEAIRLARAASRIALEEAAKAVNVLSERENAAFGPEYYCGIDAAEAAIRAMIKDGASSASGS